MEIKVVVLNKMKFKFPRKIIKLNKKIKKSNKFQIILIMEFWKRVLNKNTSRNHQENKFKNTNFKWNELNFKIYFN